MKELTVKQMDNRFTKAQAIKNEIDALKDMYEAIMQEVIDSMDAQGIDTVVTDNYKFTYKPVVTNRLDTKALKADHEDLYEMYLKVSTEMRKTLKEVKKA